MSTCPYCDIWSDWDQQLTTLCDGCLAHLLARCMSAMLARVRAEVARREALEVLP